MKKKLAILLCCFLLAGTLAGCGSGGGEKKWTLKEGTTLEDVVSGINKEIGIAMPMEVTEESLSDTFHINKEDAAEYAGKFSMSITSADNFIIIKPAEGKKDAVKAALEQRKEDVIKSFEMYLPGEYEKAKAGRILEKGDYLIFMVLGDPAEEDFEKPLDNAEKVLEQYFD